MIFAVISFDERLIVEREGAALVRLKAETPFLYYQPGGGGGEAMEPRKPMVTLPQQDISHPVGGNQMGPEPSEAEKRGGSTGEPSPISAMRVANPDVVDSAATGTLPAQGVTLGEAMSQSTSGSKPRPPSRKRKKGNLKCYVCESTAMPQQLRPLEGPEREHLRMVVELMRESRNNFLDHNVTETDKICANCHINAQQRIAADEDKKQKVSFDVVNTRGLRACIFCQEKTHVTVIPFKARVKVFCDTAKFIVKSARICKHHLRPSDGTILPVFADQLTSSKRYIYLDSEEIEEWFYELRLQVKENTKGLSAFDELPDEDFKVLTSMTKENFHDILAQCKDGDPVPGEKHKMNSRDLLLFLVKLRQGLSDQFLKVLFGYRTRGNVSIRVRVVRKTLMARFVKKHLGLSAISRDSFVADHVSDFACKLYIHDFDDIGRIKQAIVIVDGTYIYIPKSGNYRFARQSYSVHKHRHLIKPVMLVAPDGYILDVHGPYFADGKNNDASILKHHMEQDGLTLRAWLQPHDVLVVDRGYRDVIDYLDSIGVDHEMPEYLRRNMKQHTVEEANRSRLVTKLRWVVEARNGHVKTIFKFFRDTVPASQVEHIGDYFRIACALINAYHPPIDMFGATEEMAERLLQKAREPNKLMEKIEREKLKSDTTSSPWFKMDAAECLPGFPRLDLDYLRDLTFGVYQIHQAKSYVHDKLTRDNEYEIKINLRTMGILRARIYSRHTNQQKYEAWVWYRETAPELQDTGEDIKGWCCDCKAGARTVGCCAHVASVIWYLGYARHLPVLPAPSDRLFSTIQDAGNRHVIEDP